MTLPSDGPVSILPLDKYQPQGTPIGQHAFFLKMTPEALEQLQIHVAAQQEATTREFEELQRVSGRYAQDLGKKKQNPLMQLIVGENGQPQFRIGTSVFKADLVEEKNTCEIYARHRSPASDSGRSTPSQSASPSMQMVAKVDGRINVKRDYGTSVQQSVSERTGKLNKEAQPRSAIIQDAPVGSSGNSSAGSSRAQQAKPATFSKHVPTPPATARPIKVADGQAAITPPKSDGSPPSVVSSPRGPKHHVPDTFTACDLNVPTQWDRDVPIPIRIIHHLAPKPITPRDLLTEVNLAAQAERTEAIRAMDILCEKQEDGVLRLRDEAYYYLRPWCWVHYTPQNRTDASKFARIALRKLGYNDGDEAWEHLRRQNGWIDPWRNTPKGAQYYREKEEKKSKGDHEKQKAEALANPAPMLTSSFKPGFFSSSSDAKGKKNAKEKEPKAKKEKTSAKKESDKESGTQPRLAHSASQAPSSTASTSTLSAEPTVQEAEMRIRQKGPGSNGGKLAIAKRLQREKEEGRPSPVSTPSRSPRPLPSSVSTPSTSAKADSKKRKIEDTEYEDSPAKKRKAGIAPTGSLKTEPVVNSTLSKKRKGDDIQELSPPAKLRKAESTSTASAITSSQRSTVSTSNASKKPSAARKAVTSATRDYNGRRPNGRESWDYSSDDHTDTTSHKPRSNVVKREDPYEHKRSLSKSLLPTPHRAPPPTNYLGFKAVFMQKWSEYGMLSGIIMGEEAKLQNLGLGDDSSMMMSVDELKDVMRKRKRLEADLKELKVKIAHLTPKGA